METEIKELRRQVDIMIKINDNANLQFDALKKWSKRDKHFKKPNLGFRLEKIKMKSDQI